MIGNLQVTTWYASFCCFLRPILLSSLQVYLKRQFFNINICCFIIAVSCAAPELCHFEFLDKMAAGRHLRFGLTGSSATRSADPEKPTLEPNTKRIGWTIAEIMLFEIFPSAILDLVLDFVVAEQWHHAWRCGLSMATSTPNLVKITEIAAELRRFSFFQNSGRPPSWILLQVMALRHVADCPCLPPCQI